MSGRGTVSPRAVRAGREVVCKRPGCDQLLAFCRGDELDCFVFVVRHSMKMRCEKCKWENKWVPGEPWHPPKSDESVDAPDSSV